jgi:hypothetical protein
VERRDRDGCGGTASNDIDGGAGETDHDVGDLILRSYLAAARNNIMKRISSGLKG